MSRILRGMGFKHAKCEDGRKCLMESTDVTAARIHFLGKCIKLGKLDTQMYFILTKHWSESYKIALLEDE